VLNNAFWLNTPAPYVGSVGVDRFELDVIEAQYPDWAHVNVHDWSPTHIGVAGSGANLGTDLSAGYHTFGAEWKFDNTIDFYIDGNLFYTASKGAVDSANSFIPLEMLFSTKVLTDGPNLNGTQMDVDYVRAYDRAGFTGAAGSDWGADANWGDGLAVDAAAGGARNKDAVFNRAVAGGAVTLASDKQTRQVYIDGGTGALTFSGGGGAKLQLGYVGLDGNGAMTTFAGGITMNRSVTAAQTFNLPIVGVGDMQFTNLSASGAALNLNGAISAAGGSKSVSFFNAATINVAGAMDNTIRT
jgi:hypothetical protein